MGYKPTDPAVDRVSLQQAALAVSAWRETQEAVASLQAHAIGRMLFGASEAKDVPATIDMGAFREAWPDDFAEA